MKFNCGKQSTEEYEATKAEKRRAKQLAENAVYTRMVSEGEIVFALFPKTLMDGSCVWLEKVRRKFIGDGIDFKYQSIRDHRTIWEYTAL